MDGSYLDPLPGAAAGDQQGDAPTGTLTSEPIHVPDAAATADGNLRVSFLVGGGCDALTEYVELVVDGVPVDRATGSCRERLKNASFDLNPYQGRSAVLRVVDASRSRWGHVHFDHVSWSWPLRGFGNGKREGPAAATDADVEAVAAAAAGAKDLAATGGAFAGETSRAGAAYAFRRRGASASTQACEGDRELCVWELASKLLPSDRRRGDGFGSSVAVDDRSGRAAVGGPGAAGTTHWKLAPPLRPYGRAPPRDDPAAFTRYLKDYETARDTPYVDRASPVALPMDADLVTKMAREHRMLSRQEARAPASAQAVWARRAKDVAAGLEAPPQSPATDEARDAGAVYLFERSEPVVDPVTADVLVPARWGALETARLQAPERWARSFLGSAVALAGRTLLGGQPGGDAFGRSAGDALVWDPDVLRVRFLAAEFAVVEGRYAEATITIVRDAAYASQEVTVGYSTEDVTARGVDAVAYASCSGGAGDAAATTGCGDYRQTSGTATFAAGEVAAFFYVPVVDDPCIEIVEYVQLSLSVPGAPALQGENFLAKLRIDDDDWPELASSQVCPDTGFL